MIPHPYTGKNLGEGRAAWDDEWLAEALSFYALGVPAAAIAAEYGLTVSGLRGRASISGVKRPSLPDRIHLQRVARTERIRRCIEEFPNTSLFNWN